MWQKTYEITAPNLKPEQVWKVWSNINLRTQWDDDTEWAELDGPFKKGSIMRFKVKNGPKVTLEISDCIPNKVFTDKVKFIGAQLYGIHEMEQSATGLRLMTTIKITGPLTFLWRKIVGEEIVASLPHQTDLLIKLAQMQ